MAFVKLVNRELQSVSLDAVHDPPKFLRLVIGGSDRKYRGFNGQFARPVLRVGKGAFLGSVGEFQQFAFRCNP